MRSLLPNRGTRRQFLRQLGILGVGSSLSSRNLLAGSAHATGLNAAADTTNSPVIKNRAPLANNAFYLLPLGSIRPQGWLLAQLKIQANGLSGHLGEAWPDVGPNSGWLGGSGESWERGPYYLDGLIPLAYQLNDPRLKATAQKFIDWTLEHQAPNGMIGPSSNDDWWPRIVMLKALTQYAEVTNDPRVIPLMEKYFRYQQQQLATRPLRDWGKFRWQDEVLSVLWLYNRTGSANLLTLAQLLRQQGYDWQAQYADFKYTHRITPEYLAQCKRDGMNDIAMATHGVNNGQALKAGPVWSVVAGSPSDRRAVLQMISELNRYHGLPNGMFSCDEHLAGLNPSQGSELCTVVEAMFSLEQSLAIVGDVSLGDRLERLAYNALPGALTDDMWAHQYNQQPNQVECSLHQKPWTTDGPESNLYGLEPNFGCCTANFNQGWPKFASSLFMLSGEQGSSAQDGLVAAVYAPCEVRTTVRGITVHVIEETEYPFRGVVHLTVRPESPLRFPLRLRIPEWAAGTTIRVNSQMMPTPDAGTFACVDRIWNAGDSVEISFPMKLAVSRWFQNSVAIERGPLVFSYGIGESWVKLRDRGMTADWQVFPTDAWNYALQVDTDSLAESIEVEENKVEEEAFTRRNVPVQLKVKARQVVEWRAEDGAASPPPPSPVESKEPEKTITLIPYAAAKLRITAFPQIKTS